MKSKGQLEQIEVLNEIINEKLLQVSELKQLACSLGSIDYSAVRVQSSPSVGGKTNIVAKYVDLELEINQDIDDYVDKKNEIIKQIHKLQNVEHIKLLHDKYVQFKTFEEIAVDMRYSIRQIYRIHGSALQEFSKITNS
ncbi:MAG: DUF1492 domain-containing protein [Lachnospiraceae bacterium]